MRTNDAPSASSAPAGDVEIAPGVASASAGSNSDWRTVTQITGVPISTVEYALPARIGRTNWFFAAIDLMSLATPASSSAATRGIRSLPIADAAADTTAAPCSFASRATIGA